LATRSETMNAAVSEDYAEMLNAEAVALRDGGGLTDYEALMRVVEDHGLAEVARDASDQCRLYAHPGGRLVNCWVEAPEGGIRPGGMGFDAQTELHDED
jgi:hypothetical protein